MSDLLKREPVSSKDDPARIAIPKAMIVKEFADASARLLELIRARKTLTENEVRLIHSRLTVLRLDWDFWKEQMVRQKEWHGKQTDSNPDSH